MQSIELSSAHLPLEWANPAPIRDRGPKAAREFEAYLIGSLLESLQRTFSFAHEENAIAGADDYTYMGTQALARALSERGGFGIAAMITKHLCDHTKVTDQEGNSGPDAPKDTP